MKEIAHAMGLTNSSSDHCSWESVTCELVGSECGVVQFKVNTLAILSAIAREEKYSLCGSPSFVPEVLSQLSSLRVFNLIPSLFGGGITWPGCKGLAGTIPQSLGGLVNLTTFAISLNNVSGTIPENLGSNPSLSEHGMYNYGLQLSHETQISGTIPSLAAGIETFHAPGGVSGFVPLELGGSLKEFYATEHAQSLISGTLSQSLGPNLSKLQMFKPLLSGTMPEVLGFSMPVSAIDLRFAKLSGSLPVTLGSLTNLDSLRCHHTRVSGHLPDFGRTCLQDLFMMNSRISGTLLDHLWNWTSCVGYKHANINAAGTTVSGTIAAEQQFPESISEVVVGLYSTRVSGVLPISLTNHSEISRLQVSGSSLSGTLPQISSNLVSLWISNLGLSGTLPETLSTLRTARCHQDLNGNQFCDENAANIYMENVHISGTLPNISMPAIQGLSIANSSLSGSLPTSFSSLTLMTHFISYKVSGLSGSLPDLAAWPLLKHLVAFECKFSGTVPTTSRNLTSSAAELKTILLQKNAISGQLNYMTGTSSLQNLDLSHNRVSGSLQLLHMFGPEL